MVKAKIRIIPAGFIALVSLLVCCMAIAAEPNQNEKITLQLKWLHSFQFAGYYAAKEKGFYADEGLDVDLKERTPDSSVTEEVLRGHAQYGVHDAGLVLDRANGKPVVVIAGIFQHSPVAFISLKKSGIVSPYEMVGKRVMMDRVNDAPLVAMFDGAGIKPKQYHVVPHSFNYDDLVLGKVDVSSAYLTNEPYLLAQEGVEISIINPQNYGVDFPGDLLFTSEDEIQHHAERVEKMRRATIRGWDYALKHPGEISKLILTKYNSRVSHQTEGRLLFAAKQTYKLILPDVIPLGHIDSKRFQKALADYQNQGLAKPGVSLEGFIYGESAAGELALTGEEKAWLKSHAVLRVGIDRDFAPYEWVDSEGAYQGMAADMLALVAKRLGVKTVIIKDQPWYAILNMARQGKLDMIACTVKTPERDRFLNFTKPYSHVPVAIIAASNTGYLGDLDRLSGKSVSVVKGYFIEELLRREHPSIHITTADNVLEALNLVVSGKVSAYLGDAGSANHVISSSNLSGLKLAGMTNYYSDQGMAAIKTEPILEGLLQKALDSIPAAEKNSIVEHWFGLKVAPGISYQVVGEFIAGSTVVILFVLYWNLRLRREVKLRLESEKRFSNMANSAPVLIWISGNDKLCTWFNQVWLDFTGRSMAQEIGNGWAEGVHPDDYQSCLAVYVSHFDRRAPFRMEYRLRHRDGQYRWIDDHGVPRFSVDGKFEGYIGSCVDITERKLAEEKLSAMMREQQAMLESDLVGIVKVNNRIITWASPSFEKILGYNLGEMCGKPTRINFLSDEDYSALGTIAYPVLLKGGVYRTQLEHQRKDGSHIWVDMSGVMLSSTTGESLWAFVDITERKQAELAVRESHQQMHSLLNSMAEGAYGVDTEGNCTFVNRSFLQILGYDNQEELIGKHIHELIHHSHPDGTLYPASECRMYASYRQNEETHVTNEVFWRKDGMAISVEYWAQPILQEGVVTGAIATFVDITQRINTEIALRESEQRLRSIIETEPECIKVVDARGRLVEMNAAGLAMLEADSLAQAQQHTLLDYVESDDRAAFIALHHQVLNGEGGVLVFRIKGLKGTSRCLETHATPMRDASGKITSLLGVTRDVTESKKAEQQLRIAATAFESHEGMVITDANGDILKVNHAFTAITGYTAEEVIGKNPHQLNSGRHDAAFYTAMWQSINTQGSWEGEIWNRRKNGEIYPEHLTITAVRDADGRLTNYVANLTDITQSKAAAEKIEQLAFYDPLTNLPNRRLLLDRIRQALASSARSSRQGALLFIDLDNFKTLNDTLGHDIGDLLLQRVAERLAACVREDDTVARLGGDEFVIMLEDLNNQAFEAAAQVEAVGEKILTSLNQPYQLGKHEYLSTPSIGVTLFNGHEQEIEELLKQADIAMYQAKKAGRNNLRFFNPEMQASINKRAVLESQLRNALDKGQLQLYYQIQVNNSGSILGAEALIRWVHPERGMVSPAQFIPMAEESGLILPIGQWVLETACAQLAAWQQNRLTQKLSLSVNVSAKQFHKEHFSAQVQAAIQGFAIDPGLLRLELTESSVLHDVEDTIATMNTLKDLGVRFSLDDFGTGYSSLQYLKRLPIYQIKIDQSFVRDIVSDTNDEAIVRTIIAMAQSLDLEYIAEGVETEAQKQILLRNGCTHYQGYLFGRPVPIEEFESILNLKT